jgi:hypothetical protein
MKPHQALIDRLCALAHEYRELDPGGFAALGRFIAELSRADKPKRKRGTRVVLVATGETIIIDADRLRGAEPPEVER